MEMELIFISEISQLAPELFCLVAGARGGAGLREPGTEGTVWDVQTRESSSKCRSWNHGMVWVGGDLEAHLIPWAGTSSTVSGCSAWP